MMDAIVYNLDVIAGLLRALVVVHVASMAALIIAVAIQGRRSTQQSP